MDFRVKALRVSGQKDFVDSLHRLFTDKKELLKEKDFDILAPIDIEVDGSLSFMKILFMSKEGTDMAWIENLAIQFKVYITVHYLDYGELKEYYYYIAPINNIKEKEVYDFELDEYGNAVFSKGSPVSTETLYLLK